MPTSSTPCPVCKNSITFDPAALLRGDKLTCSQCETAIAVEAGGGVKATMDSFNAARRSVEKAFRKAG